MRKGDGDDRSLDGVTFVNICLRLDLQRVIFAVFMAEETLAVMLKYGGKHRFKGMDYFLLIFHYLRIGILSLNPFAKRSKSVMGHRSETWITGQTGARGGRRGEAA